MPPAGTSGSRMDGGRPSNTNVAEVGSRGVPSSAAPSTSSARLLLRPRYTRSRRSGGPVAGRPGARAGWFVAAEIPLKASAARRIVAGVALALGSLLLIIATHWGHFG